MATCEVCSAEVDEVHDCGKCKDCCKCDEEGSADAGEAEASEEASGEDAGEESSEEKEE